MFAGNLAFDIGANAGWLAALFAEKFSQVVAVEPYPPSHAAMVERATERVHPINAAVSDHGGSVTLSVRTITEGMGELFDLDTELAGWGKQIATLEVPALTLDQLANLYDIPDFVKVDTEGHEAKVLAGGQEVFAAGPEFLIEVHSEANGRYCQSYLDGFDLPYELIRHNKYNPDGRPWHDHYWLVSP